jgi:hypothetical protein
MSPNRIPVIAAAPMVKSADARQIRRIHAEQRANPDHPEDAAGDRAHQRQQHALREQLADDAAAPGADGGTDGDFAAASHGARQEQIGDVGASDQKHEAYRAD